MPKPKNRRKERALFIFLGAVGIVLLWRGIWSLADITPILENPLVSLAAGAIILVLSHQWYREL